MSTFVNKNVVVCFVKTPGYSSLKTRLASTVGSDKAEEFYRLSIACIEETLASLEDENIFPVWAVAEKDAMADPLWSSFPKIWQGEGELGDRLSKLESDLNGVNQMFFIGGDAPQITKSDFLDCQKSLLQNDFVLGPCEDGGYWIYGGTKKLGREIWTNVPYSAENTFKIFYEKLGEIGRVKKLDFKVDADYEDDLLKIADSLSGRDSSKKESLKKWIEGINKL
jgi:glycosyltransferase A (GT-A) superfamily protein (DUF2064 family)